LKGGNLGIYTSKSWVNHRQYSNPIGIGFIITRPIKPQLSMILDFSYKEFQKEYFGEEVSRHSVSLVKKELVDNLSYTYNGLIWIKNDIFIFPTALIAVAVGAGVLSIDGELTGMESGRQVSYKSLNKISGSIAVGVESLISEKHLTFWNCYLNYQFFSASVRVSERPDPFSSFFRGVEIRLGLSHIF
jgi:hypothetical protein